MHFYPLTIVSGPIFIISYAIVLAFGIFYWNIFPMANPEQFLTKKDKSEVDTSLMVPAAVKRLSVCAQSVLEARYSRNKDDGPRAVLWLVLHRFQRDYNGPCMFDLECSSLPFFVIFNVILFVMGYNWWNHFPREGGKYRNPHYYKDFNRVKEDAESTKPIMKKISSRSKSGLDSRCG